jgi:DNA-binding beta-propeller fold protein YncE
VPEASLREPAKGNIPVKLLSCSPATFSLLVLVAAPLCRPAEPVRLERTISLAGVKGRIDHLAVDVKNHRLFVAALGNNTLEVIDLKAGQRVKSIAGLGEPQGVAYVPSVNRVYVASGEDGTVRIYDGATWQIIRTVNYGDDADNVRYDVAANAIITGYGSGALGVMDLEGTKLGEIRLDSHPESFQLERNGSRVFVNLPKSRKIAVVDRATRKVTGTWPTRQFANNYPMTFDEANHRLFVAFRIPANIVVFDSQNGNELQTIETIGDADDIFYDVKRRRIYVIGGEGAVAVVAQTDPNHYREMTRVRTAHGARTGFFSPEIDRLFVAVREEGAQKAEIRVYTLE